MNNMQNEYKKQIADLKHELSKKSNDGNDKKGGGDKDRGKGKGNKKKKPYIEKNRKRWAIDKYCWTHGACNHNSNECELMAPGHKKMQHSEAKWAVASHFVNLSMTMKNEGVG